ncbi:YetF domain-containing protein [Rhodococcus sp. BUPNP1]|nr:YetF domain-containing protein [Rhodococcus sp. BUPNP1]
MAAARQQGIRRFADIDLAVLETNGKISFFVRTRAQDGAPEEPEPG